MSTDDELILPRVRSSLSGIDNTSVVDIDGETLNRSPKDLVDAMRTNYEKGLTRSLDFRKKQLKALLKFLTDCETEICEALHKDLRKSRDESIITEIEFTANEVRALLYNLDKYAKREKADKPLANFFDGLYIYKEPYGVVLVVGAWNYPLQLSLAPAAGAIAAGNTVIIKPSEISGATSSLIQTELPKYLSKDCYSVYVGGISETTKLLQEKFDYIFFTGSPQVGKIVYQAAVENLTPVTLELGGKSPVYIDDDVDIDVATKRIIWGKCLNSGQTCIGPDFILCSKEIQNEFVEKAKDVLKELYSENVRTSPDYGRIISKNHFTRLTGLFQNETIAIGGEVNEKELFIEPTVLTDVDVNSAIMQEEIFGPLLPIVTVHSAKEAIEIINKKEKALVLYVFSKNSKVVDLFIEKTSSGGICVNDTIMHIIPDSLPFGGVGQSGMGAYHGKFSFETFSHQKSVLKKNFHRLPEKLQSVKYPPYNKKKTNLLTEISKQRRSFPFAPLKYVLAFVLGVLVAVGGYYIKQYCDNS